MTLLFFFIFTYLLLCLSLYKIFEKANRLPIKAFLPGINFIEWCELIGRPKWWAILLFIPIVNIFIYAGMCIDLVRSFKHYSFWDSAKAVIYAPYIFFRIGFSAKSQYDGPTIPKEKAFQQKLAAASQENHSYKFKKLQEKNPYKKTALRDWAEAVAFAVFAAAFIRLFTIEAYAIPTSSMEGSLNVGDHLFVSKIHYGLRTPSTVLMLPLMHNRLPFFDKESYIEKPNLPSFRLPAIESLDRNDPVVFNMPEGDSVYITPGRNWTHYDLKRNAIPQATAAQILKGKYPLVTRPIDKIDHYVKHCIGKPGETLQIIDRQVFIDENKVKNPKHLQYRYLIKYPTPINEKRFSEWGITEEDQQYYNADGPNHKMLILSDIQKAKIQNMDGNIEIILNDMYWVEFPASYDKSKLVNLGINDAHVRASSNEHKLLLTLTKTQKAALQSSDPKMKVERYSEANRLFPHDEKNYGGWNVDNYGPLWIPKAGETKTINLQNIAPYRRIIDIYEDNDFVIKDNQIYINGIVATEYTFKQDYYWMMGDNRNNSEDSRMWGFVPETHILGKPLFIYFSTKENQLTKGINWDRMFTSASKAD